MRRLEALVCRALMALVLLVGCDATPRAGELAATDVRAAEHR